MGFSSPLNLATYSTQSGSSGIVYLGTTQGGTLT